MAEKDVGRGGVIVVVVDVAVFDVVDVVVVDVVVVVVVDAAEKEEEFIERELLEVVGRIAVVLS